MRLELPAASTMTAHEESDMGFTIRRTLALHLDGGRGSAPFPRRRVDRTLPIPQHAAFALVQRRLDLARNRHRDRLRRLAAQIEPYRPVHGRWNAPSAKQILGTRLRA